mmetsp:Transcript_21100/g.27449  ORF Transcript_21100/g.27449 Transcript_21100/m.27449 type:complete len:218 (+) Transcript_21100:133-786(+)
MALDHLKFEKLFGSESQDWLSGLYTKEGGNLILTGHTNGTLGEENFGLYDGFITAINNNGEINTIHQFGTSKTEYVYAISTLSNNNQNNENDNENNDEKGKEKEEIDEYDNEELLNLLSMKTKTEGLTLLHMASRLNKVKFVMLLLEAGANPTILDSHLRPPYYLTSSKDVRDGFRKYRGKYPNKFSSWQSSQVPEPLTNEMIDRKKEKEKEKGKSF